MPSPTLGPMYDPPRDLEPRSRQQRIVSQQSTNISRLQKPVIEPIHYIGNGANDSVTVAFQNSWVHYDANSATPNFTNNTYRNAGFYRDRGRTYLTGVIKNGTISLTPFTLPVGYRSLTDALIIPLVSNGASGYMTVYANGTFQINGSNTWVSFDGINFRS